MAQNGTVYDHVSLRDFLFEANFRNTGSTWTLGLLFVIPCLVFFSHIALSPKTYSHGNRSIEAPFFGPRGWFARLSFARHAREYIQSGYDQAKESCYKLSGGDIVVLPTKYVNELRSLPDNIVSSIQANIDNFEGLHSTTSLLLEGDLHTRTIQQKLTPKLATLVAPSVETLEKILPVEIGVQEGGETAIPAFHLMLRLVSQIAARHFVGFPTCEDKRWIATALQYTENAFKTIVFLRCFPDWLKPVIGVFLPWGWLVRFALWKAKRIIVPIVEQRRAVEALAASSSGTYERPGDFLQMMMDNAIGEEGRADKLAHRLLILTLAAAHTTSMAATQTLYDLCVRPEYIEILREEVKKITNLDGGGFHKTSLTQMRKMDSFMRESQRLSPPSLLGFKRATRQSIRLSDGFELPAWAHLMMPVYPTVTDPAVVGESPMEFDGLRHWRARQLPGERNRHQFATTSATNLHFGHGKYACPGRFFAANNIKLVLAMLLLRYDFHLTADSTRQEAAGKDVARPKDVCVHEYVFPNPWAKVSFAPRAGP